MKYLKRINENSNPTPDPNWDEYVVRLFNEFLPIYLYEFGNDLGVREGGDLDLFEFFHELNEEVEDSDSINVWVVECKLAPNLPSEFEGLANAYGEKNAIIKVAIATKQPDLIFGGECWVPDDEDIEDNKSYIRNQIVDLENKIKKWDTIL
jgi:hypothetical protein